MARQYSIVCPKEGIIWKLPHTARDPEDTVRSSQPPAPHPDLEASQAKQSCLAPIIEAQEMVISFFLPFPFQLNKKHKNHDILKM